MKIWFIKLLLVVSLLSLFFTKGYSGKVDSLKTLYENTDDSYLKVQLLNSLSIEYLESNYQEAIKVANEALNLAKHNDYESGIIRAYIIIGYSYFFYNNYAKALENYFLAIKYLKKTTDYTLLAETYSNAALIYNYIENPKQSIYYNKLCLMYLKKKPDNDILVNCYFNMAKSYRLLKDHNRELYYLKKGIKIRKYNNQFDKLGLEYNKLGSAYFNLHQYDTAARYYTNYLEISLKVNDSLGLARSYHNLGSVYYAIGQYSKSIEFFKKSIDLKQSNISLSQLELVYSYGKLNNLKSAFHYFDLAKKGNLNQKLLSAACDSLVNFCEKTNNIQKSNFYLHLAGRIKDSIIIASVTDLEATLKPRLEVEGIEERIIEKENNQLLKQNLTLQRKYSYALLIAVILLLVILIYCTFFILRNYWKRKYALSVLIEANKSTMSIAKKMGNDIASFKKASL